MSLRRAGGPEGFFEVADTVVWIWFISPLSNNLCDGSNRIRITATGTIDGFLGHCQYVELRDAIRSKGREGVDRALDAVMAAKPRRHEFEIARSRPAVARHMSVTGG